MVCLNVVDVGELVWGVLVMPLRRWEPAMVPLMRCCRGIDAADALRALECAADPLMTGGIARDAREFL